VCFGSIIFVFSICYEPFFLVGQAGLFDWCVLVQSFIEIIKRYNKRKMFDVSLATSEESLNQLKEAYFFRWSGKLYIDVLYNLWYYNLTVDSELVSCRGYFSFKDTITDNINYCNSEFVFNTKTKLWSYILGSCLKATSEFNGNDKVDLLLLTSFYDYNKVLKSKKPYLEEFNNEHGQNPKQITSQKRREHLIFYVWIFGICLILLAWFTKLLVPTFSWHIVAVFVIIICTIWSMYLYYNTQIVICFGNSVFDTGSQKCVEQTV
jgi:hypothetical protein